MTSEFWSKCEQNSEHIARYKKQLTTANVVIHYKQPTGKYIYHVEVCVVDTWAWHILKNKNENAFSSTLHW